MMRNIQALRAIACLLVVAYHALDGTWENGSAGVDLFFVISGLVMGLSSTRLASRPDGWRIFAVRRLRRVVPLYWSLTLAKLAIGVALPATLAASRPGAWTIVASFLFIPARDGAGMVRPVLGVGWTLQFEMLFYLLFGLCLAARVKPLRVLLPLLALLTAAGFWRQPGWPAPASYANGLVLEFGLGLLVAQYAERLARVRPVIAAAAFTLGAVLLMALPSGGAWRFALWGLPATCVVAGATGLERSVGRTLPPMLLGLGDASYAIYLVHPFLVPVILRSVGPASLRVCVAIVIASLVGWGVHRWERHSFFSGEKKRKSFLRLSGTY